MTYNTARDHDVRQRQASVQQAVGLHREPNSKSFVIPPFTDLPYLCHSLRTTSADHCFKTWQSAALVNPISDLAALGMYSREARHLMITQGSEAQQSQSLRSTRDCKRA